MAVDAHDICGAFERNNATIGHDRNLTKNE